MKGGSHGGRSRSGHFGRGGYARTYGTGSSHGSVGHSTGRHSGVGRGYTRLYGAGSSHASSGHSTGRHSGIGHGAGAIGVGSHGFGTGVRHGLGHGIGHGLGSGLGHGIGYGVGHGIGYGLGHGGYGFGHGYGYGGYGYGSGYGYGHYGLGLYAGYGSYYPYSGWYGGYGYPSYYGAWGYPSYYYGGYAYPSYYDDSYTYAPTYIQSDDAPEAYPDIPLDAPGRVPHAGDAGPDMSRPPGYEEPLVPDGSVIPRPLIQPKDAPEVLPPEEEESHGSEDRDETTGSTESSPVSSQRGVRT